ncbi:hypothetical protein Taro_055579 [Colocasia esculenta]|uniref:Uncharacterized protein n=1 Tax=Colocasia esculenta TaxID=4460 RepID=A0A843XTD6_COLES|nr:hypothetical protein [Colocasia esculenta]
MSPSGLLKVTKPMSPSEFQRVKCPSREHKPQFVPFHGETFFSGELRLGSSVGAWEEVVWPSCKEGEVLGSWEEVRGSSELRGETSQQFPLRRSEETGPQ